MIKDKLNIALVVAETAPIPDVLGGGAERLVTMLIDQNEIEKKANFYVISKYNIDAKEKAKIYKYSKFIYIKNNNVIDKIYNYIIKKVNLVTNKLFLKRGYYNVASSLLTNNCDIIIDQNGYVPEIFYFTKKYGKKKVLAHVHWKVNPSERKIENLYGGIIGVSKYIENYWLEHSGNKDIKGMVVYSAVDEKRFESSKEDIAAKDICSKYSISNDDVVFIYCGRLHEQKGVRELIEAFNDIKDNNIKLLIVGGSYIQGSSISEYENNLHMLAKLNKNIIFTGYINNSEMYKFYNLADVQVIPTIVEEAAGLVAIEGMLCGLPILATRSGGLPEYLNDDCAIIVDNDEKLINNLKESIELLYRDEDKRNTMSKAAKKRAKLFSQKKYYDDFMKVIEEYCKNKEII